MNIAAYCLFTALGFFLCYQWFVPSLKKKVEALTRRTDFWDKRYDRKQGFTTTYNGSQLHYDLRTWDGGKNWYAVDNDKAYKYDDVSILGKAEDVYPGLLKHLKAWEKLGAHAFKNRGIKPDDLEGIDLLKDAGFTV